MIIFEKVRFRNFLSYGNQFTEIDLNTNPTTVLVGESGAGKSTLTDAIVFALFGKPFRAINKPQLVNTINGGDCMVEIEFSIGSNHYKVCRGIKPNLFEIYCNGTLLNQDSHSKDYQEHLEKNILKMNYKTFLQIVVLGLANFTPFMQMKPIDRRALIEDLLDIQVFSRMSSLLKDKISENKTLLTENENALRNGKEKITIYEKYIEDVKKDRQEIIDANLVKIKESGLEIIGFTKEVDGLTSQIEELNKLIEDENEVNEKLRKYDKYRIEVLNNLKNLNKEMKFYETNESCPTCNREFEAGFKKEVIETRSSKKEEYEKACQKIDEKAGKIKERSQEIDKEKVKIRTIKDKVTQLEAKKSSALQYLKKLKRENEELESKKKDITDEISKLKDLKESIQSLELDRESIHTKKAIYDLATTLLKDGGIKSKIIKQYVPIINKLVNQFLSSMNFFVSFSIDENFEENIKSRGRDVYTYSCFSDGERQRLDIAILLTWRTIATLKNSVKTNLLFIDELLDSCLDQTASENVLELINNEPILKNTNIFIVTHKNGLTDRFSNKIVFAKQKNFSIIAS